MQLLRVSNVSFQYESGHDVLDTINLEVDHGQQTAIIGETGSGKSSLLRIMAGLEQPAEGSVVLNGVEVKGPEHQLIPGHPEIAYLPQDSKLPKFLSVRDALSISNSLTEEAALSIFEICDIEHLLEHDTRTLSGGEKQRVAMANALCKSPQLLLLDEPYSNLDIVHKSSIKKVIQKISNEFDTTCILVSHDPIDVLPWADVIVVLKHGRIIQRGAPSDLYNKPVNSYVAGLFGHYNLFDKANWKFSTQRSTTFDKMIMVRPEEFVISKDFNSVSKARVVEILYYGSFELLKLEFENRFIHVRAKVGSFEIDEIVSIDIS